MGFKCGIVGLPNVGKSTLFNALTEAEIESENYPFCTIEPNVGVVPIADDRLDKLSNIVNPKKVLPTVMEFVDIAGLVKGASQGEGLGNQFLANIRETEAIVHVVRAFENEDIVHVAGKVSPIDDIEVINTELVLADLGTVEKLYQKASKSSKSGEKEGLLLKNLLEKILPNLENGENLRSLTFSNEEQKLLRGFQLLTTKPVLYVANVSENGFNEEMGQSETGLDKLVKAGYELLGLRTFFTAGPKEVRAWTINIGDKAPQAAGKIHGDFEKGFIRAETISFEDYISNNGEKGAKEAGKLRSEGKEYIVQDGDVMHFLFNN